MLFVEQSSREINFFALKHWRQFLFLETFDHVPGNEIDQVSLIFISEYANTWDADFVL